MQDNELIRLFYPLIANGLAAAGYPGVTVIQANEPTQQGVPTNPLVTFTKISDHRYGFLSRKDVWNALSNTMVHSESQVYETTFQVNALVLQRPANTYRFTASDLVNAVAAIMQSDATRATLMASNVGVLRVQEVTNTYFKDDMDNFEASPSFDFVLTYNRGRVTTTPVITLPITINTYPV